MSLKKKAIGLALIIAVLAGMGHLFREDLSFLWGGYATPSSSIELVSSKDGTVALLSARILRKVAHDPKLFVQGLQFVGDHLYEGVGLYAKSQLIRYHFNRESGSLNIVWRKDLAADEFGEGIAALDGVLYQLTWKRGRVHRYRESGEGLEEIPAWINDREGWGLTTDGESLIASDGSATLFFRSAKDFSIERTIQVRHRDKPVVHLNELEFIDGKIWANVWKTDHILVIDPRTGVVTAVVDCSELVADARSAWVDIDFLNGIAWDKVGGHLYLTGKFWPWIYQVSLEARS